MSQKLLTVRAVAAELGVDQTTVRRWINAGRLEAHRFGPRTIRVPAAAVEALGAPMGAHAA